ncbi:protein brambleberry-like [Periplaneta americana]|uniref:protein brambleberry-like n=1 Tax=Periplaneta americana TaxID=6978 RepID=UPI0037E79455
MIQLNLKYVFPKGRYKVSFLLCLFYLLILEVPIADSSFLDWFWGGDRENVDMKPKIGDVPNVKVPFEVTTEDVKFLEEAKKYTSLKLSDLDSCQHQIVMKIRNSCVDMTEEELAKLSVNLLNCQSAVEGRQQFPCTSSMSLRECTSSMDSDMWNTYHLMNNRARAVCYAARHQQFRAMSEMTVNKLMDTAHNQLDTMNSLKEGQKKLESITSNTMESISQGHQSLMDQQEKLRVTQRNIQDFVTLNLRELTREKALIAAGHRELAKMTEDVKKKLDEASMDLSNQVNERRDNHKQLLQDLESIQAQAALIWERIDESTQQILAQHASAAAQYESTLHKLAQINTTVNFLLNLMDKTRHELDERLGWLTRLLGGTGEQVDRLYSCVLHILFLVVGMITAAFVRAPTLTRTFLLLVVPLNLAVTYHHGDDAALNFPSMTILILASTAVHWMIQTILHYWSPKQPVSMMYLPPQPMSNGFVPTTSPTKPSDAVRSHVGMLTKLKLSAADVLKRLNSFFNNWTRPRGSVSDSPRIRIPTPVLPKDLSDESSDSDDIVTQDDFPEGLKYSNYGSSDFLRARSGTPTLRQRSSTPVYHQAPPTPSHTSSRSGTPSRPGTPRPYCRAICRTGQPCRNSASAGSDVCRRHALDSSFRSY